MRNGSFDAELPVDVESPTTDDDAFEHQARSMVMFWYPGLAVEANPAIPSGHSYLRPDIAARFPGTARYLLVAEAKRVQRLRRKYIDRIAHIRDVVGADRAVLFCKCFPGPSSILPALAGARG